MGSEGPQWILWPAATAWLEPAVQTGLGGPGPFAPGLLVLETTGIRTGTPQRVLLVASFIDGCVFVGTLLGPRCRWMSNLRADPCVRYWLAGRERTGYALVFAPGVPRPGTRDLPLVARAIADGWIPMAVAAGWRFAVIR